MKNRLLLLLFGIVVLIEPHPVLSQEWQLEPSNLISSCDRNSNLRILRAEIDNARAILHANSEFVRRMQALAKEGVISQAQLDAAVARETLARTRLTRLQAELESEYKSRMLSYEQAQAQLRRAEDLLQTDTQLLRRIQPVVAQGALADTAITRQLAHIQISRENVAKARENVAKAQACLMER